MLDYGYSITLCYWLPLVAPSVMYLWYTPMQSNHRGLCILKNLEIPKGRTILNWGRLYNDKPKLYKRCILLTPTNPSYTYNKPMYIPMLHTPIQTMVYTNATNFCSIHNTHKPMYHLYVLKPYTSIHMYHAIEYTIVIYNR